MASLEYHVELITKAKASLMEAANKAEIDGYQVNITFHKDLMPERHKGKPHDCRITISKEIK